MSGSTPFVRRQIVASAILGLLLMVSSMSAQAVPERLQFSVASVKEDKADMKTVPSDSNIPLLDPGDSYISTGGRLSTKSIPVLVYLIFAYKVQYRDVAHLSKSLPRWAVEDRFDIEARTDIENPTKDQMRAMMRSLLEDRFAVEVHRSAEQAQVFGLYLAKVGKLGSQLKAHDIKENCTSLLPLPKSGNPFAKRLGNWPPYCGHANEVRSTKYLSRLGGRDMSMSEIADNLTGDDIPLPVVDRTGLSGTYDFIVEYGRLSLRTAAPLDSNEDMGPSLQQAVEDQLGLKMKKEMATLSFFHVDRVERPTAN